MPECRAVLPRLGQPTGRERRQGGPAASVRSAVVRPSRTTFLELDRNDAHLKKALEDQGDFRLLPSDLSIRWRRSGKGARYRRRDGGGYNGGRLVFTKFHTPFTSPLSNM